jgi:hypothetical protein
VADRSIYTLEDLSGTVFQAIYGFAEIDDKVWLRDYGIWPFIKALRVFQSWVYEDFLDRSRHRLTQLLAASTGDYFLDGSRFPSPFHGLLSVAADVKEAFYRFPLGDGLGRLPLCLSTRQPAAFEVKDDWGILRPAPSSYQSLLEDVMDAWPHWDTTFRIDLLNDLTTFDHRDKKRVHVYMEPASVMRIIDKYRSMPIINERLKDLFNEAQWVSIMNLWVASEEIALSFEPIVDLAKVIDFEEWSYALDRQLARLSIAVSEAPSRSASVVNRETTGDTELTLSTPDGPIKPDGFRWGGKCIYGLTPTEFDLLKFIFDRSNDWPSLEELKKEFWKDSDTENGSFHKFANVLRSKLAPLGIGVHARRKTAVIRPLKDGKKKSVRDI